MALAFGSCRQVGESFLKEYPFVYKFIKHFQRGSTKFVQYTCFYMRIYNLRLGILTHKVDNLSLYEDCIEYLKKFDRLYSWKREGRMLSRGRGGARGRGEVGKPFTIFGQNSHLGQPYAVAISTGGRERLRS